MNKVELIAAAKQQWTKSEASIGKAAKGNFDAKPADGGWSAADIYRHMVDTAHKIPEAMKALMKDGTRREDKPVPAGRNRPDRQPPPKNPRAGRGTFAGHGIQSPLFGGLVCVVQLVLIVLFFLVLVLDAVVVVVELFIVVVELVVFGFVVYKIIQLVVRQSAEVLARDSLFPLHGNLGSISLTRNARRCRRIPFVERPPDARLDALGRRRMCRSSKKHRQYTERLPPVNRKSTGLRAAHGGDRHGPGEDTPRRRSTGLWKRPGAGLTE